MATTIHWPHPYEPGNTAVHVSNELLIDAPIENVWAWLIRAPLWPTWYENSNDVVIEDNTGPDLQPGTPFRWKTFGLSIESVVGDFVPMERIGWTGKGLGMDVYHGWALDRRGQQTYVLTQENQNGLAARAQSVLAPHRMHKYHQIWLESLQRQAQSGPPPMPANPNASE